MRSVRVVFFDAVGTLIYPRPAADEVYYRVGRDHGSRLTLDEVRRRIREAWTFQGPTDRHGTWTTDRAQQRDRWRQIVARVLADIPQAARDAAFEVLWKHFARGQSWQFFDDVVPTARCLRARGLKIGVASNFDERLDAICRTWAPWMPVDYVFHAADLGVCKPSAAFYQAIQRHIGISASALLMVGDGWNDDYRGARQAGWQAVWLDRSGRGRRQTRWIADLRQLIDLLPWDEPG